ncbi:hypothetical protein SAMN04487848_0409 [Microbacterium sp. ru370.1]|uniref:hypothetical protein n=1 Tax=unclassified Microbacterium TaxID=2609290 RepID=UPI000884F856|nr:MULTISPECIES: hypothetical protein [unclassified Microbacterium]SDO32695.1 hypothetical protein SAMN04487848_0409 [Microbacterium sp. ru370.1]SIT76851.1 hypothetical protein SAMN05880579_0405 [Microbacterium sp. RU1D]
MPALSIELIDDEILDAGDGIHLPRSWVAVVTGLPDIPGAVRAHVVYDPALRRAAAEWIRVDRSGQGDEVTTTLLRDLRVQAIVKWAASRVVRIDGGLSELEAYGQYLRRLRADASRSEDQNLREAVRLYRLASVINDGPLKLVSEELGVSVSTATRMMNRARVAGLVDEATGREVLVQAREQQLREQFTGPVVRPGSSGPSIGR